ncbi:hypothetical protein FISHEDRAFT_55357 [Fistulina hepatica ATCC 64428]|uniref:DUF6534 domain-containing protein n=1 Tax=Fistulina hepatica ATCC 64428 TaxID=1128425 RepID=A0A0D7AN51_9AGAR|nr:hypothetical protein FISHEDRAFT_55357 [Fistulina hepatica ATCC 64428]
MPQPLRCTISLAICDFLATLRKWFNFALKEDGSIKRLMERYYDMRDVVSGNIATKPPRLKARFGSIEILPDLSEAANQLTAHVGVNLSSGWEKLDVFFSWCLSMGSCGAEADYLRLDTRQLSGLYTILYAMSTIDGSVLGPFYGAYFMGLALCSVFWGMTTLQLAFYFMSYGKDPICLKLLCTNSLSSTSGTLTYPPSHLGFSPTNMHSRIIPTILRVADLSTFLHRPPFLLDVTIAYFAVAAAIDVFFCVMLTLKLWSSYREKTFNATLSTMLGRLLILSVNTGTWTALWAACSIILYKVSSHTIIYVVFDMSLSPLYANTLLMNLNARDFVRDGDTIVNQLSFIHPVSIRTACDRQPLESFEARSGMQASMDVDSSVRTSADLDMEDTEKDHSRTI